MTTNKIKTGLQYRSFQIDRREIDRDGRTVPVAFSSETPVLRWYGMEILDHSPGSVRLDRLRNGGPFLLDHNSRQQIGVIEEVTIGADRKGRAVVRFGKGALAEEVFQDVLDGIRTNISVGYLSHRALLEKREGENETYRTVDWEPVEISSVSIPADATVGVGRAAEADHHETVIEHSNDKETVMAEEIKTETRTPEAPAPVAPAVPETRSLPADTGAELRERARIREIEAIAEAFPNVRGIQDLRRQFIDTGKPLDAFRSAVMERLGAKPVDLPEPKDLLSEREAKQYSYRNAISAALAAVEGRSIKCFETEVSETIRASMPPSYKGQGGVMVPYQLRAGLDATNSTKGPEVVFDQPGEFIALLRNVSAALTMGARLMTGLQGPVTFPRQDGAGTAYWLGENAGSNVTESNILLGTVPMAPKTLQSTTSYSRQLLAQASFDVEAIVRGDLAAIHALAWDRAVFHGTGANNQPTGIYYALNVNAHAAGGAPDYDDLIDMITAVAIDNAILGTLGWVTTPGMAGKLLKTSIEAATNAVKIWSGTITDGLLAGYKAMATNQILATLGDGGSEHGLIFGNWADVLIGTWGQGVELVVDPYALKKQGMIEVTSFQMCDIALRHPESFCKATGATI